MIKLAFLDTETTGLDSDRHDVWEIGLVLRDGDTDTEHLWRVKPDLTKADPTGLRIGRFYERTRDLLPAGSRKQGEKWSQPEKVAAELARLLDGAHIVGAVPDFDARFLTRFLARHGQAFTAHYHLIDVETLAVGYLHGHAAGRTEATEGEVHGVPPLVVSSLPWRSDDLSRAVGVEPPGPGERHTALGDARWCMRLYDAITRGTRS